MWEKLQKLLDRFESRYSLAVILFGGTFASASLSWLAKQLKLLAPYGWPEAIFIGLMTTCLLLLTGGFLLSVWLKVNSQLKVVTVPTLRKALGPGVTIESVLQLLTARKEQVALQCKLWSEKLNVVKSDYENGIISKEKGEIIVKDICIDKRTKIELWTDPLFDYACHFAGESGISAVWNIRSTGVLPQNFQDSGWVSMGHAMEYATIEMIQSEISLVIDKAIASIPFAERR